jgi:hypothetical protein
VPPPYPPPYGAIPGEAMPLAPRPYPPLARAPRHRALDNIEGNQRGITRQEVESAISDWRDSHAAAPLCGQ